MAMTLEELRAERQRRSGGSSITRDQLLAERARRSGVQPEAQSPSWLQDVGASVASGIGSGIAGIPDILPTIGNAIGSGVGWVGDKVGLDGEALGQAVSYAFPGADVSSNPTRDVANALTGDALNYEPTTTAGDYAQTFGEFLPAAMATGPGGFARNVLQYAALPAVASETAGQLTEGSSLEPYARALGAFAAPVAYDSVARALLPRTGAQDPIRQAQAELLRREGIDVSAGQQTGNEALRRLEGNTRAGVALSDTQMEQFTGRVLREIGEDATRATPDVLQRASRRIGSVFDDVASGVDINPTTQQAQSALDAVADYAQLNAGTNQAPIITNVADKIMDAATGGQSIASSDVMSWRSLLSRATTSNDPATKQAAADLIEILDDSLSSSLNALGRSSDVSRLSEARSQWRNLLAVERSATRAGEGTAAGLITPDSLRSVLTTQGRSAMARGNRGDIGEIARAGAGVMGGLRNSGTPAGLQALGIPTMAGAGAGSSVGAALAGPAGAAIGSAVGMLAPQARNALLMTNPVQRALINQNPNLADWGYTFASPVANALIGAN